LRGVGAVAGGALGCLTGTFERRKMIGHGAELPLLSWITLTSDTRKMFG
jgi:hypothetical protein